MTERSDDRTDRVTNRRVGRRTLLSTVGAGTVLALAGCAGSEDEEPADDTEQDDEEESDETEQEDDDSSDTDDGADDETETLDTPVEVPADEECAVCNMIAADHPDYNAQLVHESESRVHFCSSGCLAAYTADPTNFGDDDTPIENAWTTCRGGELIDATTASYVRVTDSDHVDDIMKMNPVPFSDQEDAAAFVDQLNDEFDGGYSDDDIISYDAFDMELAMQYRGRFFEES